MLIDKLSVLTVCVSTEPETVLKFPLVSVISPRVIPIFPDAIVTWLPTPVIDILFPFGIVSVPSTVKLVNEPKLVTLGWAAVKSVPVKFVEFTSVALTVVAFTVVTLRVGITTMPV